MVNVNAFSDIRGQEVPIARLLSLLERQAIPHALLFTGIDGIGKGTVAKRFAMAVNCLRRGTDAATELPCGGCRSCRRIHGDLHPDVLQVEPQGAFIRIDQIRALCDTLALKPYEAQTRLAILHDAQALNPEAGNALLKVLEEPPAGTVLILTADQTSDLLETIVSRCRRVRFNPLRRGTIAALLAEAQLATPELATTLAAMSGGSYVKAAAMADGNWARRRQWVLASLGLLDPRTMAKQPVSRLLAYAEQLVKAKDHLDDALELIKTWLRDLLVVNSAPERVLHKDLMSTLPPEARRLDGEVLVAAYEAVESAQTALRGNANARLCIEALVLELSDYVAVGSQQGPSRVNGLGASGAAVLRRNSDHE
jgi:DNA polymerase-3 subunit delta'